ncbi:MAG: (2Fe-2S)-binding protein [Bacteroidia bacterium]|nr:(2Fe-2S)-binding protein [Bacteroidia bacterium]
MKKTVKRVKVKQEESVSLSLTVNGNRHVLKVRPAALLLDVLRDVLKLKGTKPGCHEGECGACTVLVNDIPVNSCLYLAVRAEGKKITTVEGLTGPGGALSAVQNALVEEGAVQCGFCTPGMAISMQALLNTHKSRKKSGRGTKSLSRDDIKKHFEGNLCRCTGYVKIIDAAEKLLAQSE